MSAMDDKIANLKNERSYAINAKIDTYTDKKIAYDEDIFTNTFLHGDTNDIGIQDLIKLYYEEKNFEQGTSYSWPKLEDYGDTGWEEIYTKAISVYGDKINGFYPPDQYGYGALVMNKETPYLKKNGESVGTTGLLSFINAIDNAIGDSASAVGDARHVSGYNYSSSAAAEAAGNAIAATEAGSGLRGKRTENSTVTTQTDGDSWRYTVGDGGTDTPNYYSNPEKDAFLDSIEDLAIAIGDTGDSYRIKLQELYTEIIKIKGDSNELFNESNIVNYAPNDGDSINAYRDDLDTYAGDSVGDSYAGDTTLWGFYNYYGDTIGSASNFDTYLTHLETFIGDTIQTRIETRHDSITGKIGDTITSNNLKKARYFWIEQRIGKPMATLINYTGMDDAITIAEDKLNDIDERLDFLINTPDNYIPIPEVYVVYTDPRYNDNEVVEQNRASIVWGGQRHATEYKIYRKETSNVAYNNTAWGDTYLLTTWTTIDKNTEVISTQYTDASISLGKKYIYRIKITDDTNDPSYTSRSNQSYIFEDGDTVISISSTKIEFGDSYNLKKGEYVLLVLDVKTSGSGFYYIEKADNTSIIVSPKVSIKNTDTGVIYKIASAIFM